MTLVKRLVNILVIMFGVSIIIFGLTRVLPGDPIAAAMGDMPSDAHIERMRSEMGLDKPIVLQYVDFVVGLSKGRMGLSITERRDVAEIVVQRLPATIELVTAAILLSLVIGVPLGVISAKYKGRPGDHISRHNRAFSALPSPNFWIAIMIQMIFGLFFALLPITGRITGPPPDAITGLYVVDSILTLNATALRDSIRHLAAPAFVLASGPIASIALMLRAKMIDESAKPYSELAAALGMHPLIISYKYLLRNSFSATLTLIGVSFPDPDRSQLYCREGLRLARYCPLRSGRDHRQRLQRRSRRHDGCLLLRRRHQPTCQSCLSSARSAHSPRRL